MSETAVLQIIKPSDCGDKDCSTQSSVIQRDVRHTPQLSSNNDTTEQESNLNIKKKEHDPRLQYGPYFMSDWKRSIPYVDNYFAVDKYDEPHNKRKRTMLAKYPQIRQLFGYTYLTPLVTATSAIIQFITTYLVVAYEIHWIPMIILAYVIGGTCCQLMGVILHECTHNLAGKTKFENTLCGYLANSILVVPIYASFRRHHLDHHCFQGVIDKDPDLPISWEIPLIKGNSLMKCIWLFMFPGFYLIRGLKTGKSVSMAEVMNWVIMVPWNVLVYLVFGPYGFLYMICSSWFSFGVHVAATHFIQEHYTFGDGQETYSYYGSGNLIFLNIGYHNEHHDFAHIPWNRLPELKKIAAPFYENLQSHNSWFKVIFTFLFNPQFGPQSRVVRHFADHQHYRHCL